MEGPRTTVESWAQGKHVLGLSKCAHVWVQHYNRRVHGSFSYESEAQHLNFDWLFVLGIFVLISTVFSCINVFMLLLFLYFTGLF